MSVESGSKGREALSNKGFFDYIREWWNSLKNFLSEKFSAIKDTLRSLNILKKDVVSSWTGSSWTHDASPESREKDSKTVREKLLEIVARWRRPWDVEKDDLWSVSLWMLQWHWANAVKLLKRLKNHNPGRFNSIMTDSLFGNLDKAWMSVWNDTQKAQYKTLMQDSGCQQVAKDMALETVDGYLNLISKWWVTDARATLARWRICNAWPWFAENIKNDMLKSGKNINDYKEVISSYRKTDFWKKYNKFDKRYSYFWGKNLEDVIGTYTV